MKGGNQRQKVSTTNVDAGGNGEKLDNVPEVSSLTFSAPLSKKRSKQVRYVHALCNFKIATQVLSRITSLIAGVIFSVDEAVLPKRFLAVVNTYKRRM